VVRYKPGPQRRRPPRTAKFVNDDNHLAVLTVKASGQTSSNP